MAFCENKFTFNSLTTIHAKIVTKLKAARLTLIQIKLNQIFLRSIVPLLTYGKSSE